MTAAAECPNAKQLEAFSSGRLTDAEADAISKHIACCLCCVAALEQLSTNDALIDAVRAQKTATQTAADAEAIRQIIQAARRLCLVPAPSI
jgi:hypothetical protein